MSFGKPLGLLMSVGLSACTLVSHTPTYAPPEDSGLVGVRPYPTQNDVCMVIGENALTSNYLDHTETLIGCPVHEVGAIEDHLANGGNRLETIGAWMLISVPN